jgi:hypothetical protein
VQALPRSFSKPYLGDQSYGLFIFYGEKGGVFGYLSAFDEPAWEDITKRLKQAGLFTTSKRRDDIECFQRVIAASADTISGQSLVLLSICPSCHSDSIFYGDTNPLGIYEIPSVTFHDYQLLSAPIITSRNCARQLMLPNPPAETVTMP